MTETLKKEVDMTPEEYQLGVLKTASCDKKKITHRLTGFVEPPLKEDMFNLLHSALGVQSELCEFLEAREDEHIIEELGDILWYTTLGISALGETLTIPDIEHLIKRQSVYGATYTTNMMTLSGDISSAVKAYLYYGREIENESLLKKYRDLSCCLFCFANTWVSPFELMAKNREKLLNKERGRYKNSVFSEDAANVRNIDSEYEAMRLVEGKDD
jgi:hypothetical protein